ncbi:AraC family transcriptional regulator [Paenibacillus mendelii]|uniref:Helix-turn-helix domain-containing protein n=1 Tax=Paenibacillus mendelii TaxID=206163 RepID=A0ABV6J8G3_9BACL|nr:AraC family transcriptional regulator [Paenibacillus mendelii]MCQ6562103.1 AraC family transcriptional regulator [Paenibacillus mendelii]
MNLLFDPIKFGGKQLLWNHRLRNEANFGGYYHWHPCCEMLFVHEGQGSVIVNQQTYAIRRGMLFFFQPFQLHKVYAQVSSESPYVRTILHFDPAVISVCQDVFPVRYNQFNVMCHGQMKEHAYDLIWSAAHMEWLFDLYNKAAGEGRGESQEEMAYLIMQLVSGIQAAGTASGETNKRIEPRTVRYSETIMRWIEAHYTEVFSLEKLAEAAHLSKFYVSRIFRQETGSSITDYLIARRIKQACRLLQTTTLPIERIGIEVGLPNVSYFIQLFKKVVGTTPLKYRQQQ